MPPRLNLICASRSLVLRSRPSIAPRQHRIFQATARRCFADEKTPKPAVPSNEEGIGHVSEEAAEVGKVTGETVPDISQGTPVQEILERDGDMDIAPGVMKDDAKAQQQVADEVTFQNLLALGQMENIANGGTGYDPVFTEEEGHKFGLPILPLARSNHLKHRYDPVVNQVTNLIMQHGKKSVAQRNMSFILNHLRTSPPPVPSPAKPLLQGAPTPAQLPLDPIAYLTLAIDSVAPLVRIRSQKGAAGGGASLQIPVPLGAKQRRRQAMQWIIDAASKKTSRGSGRGQFAQRIAEELIGVVEGRSGAWDKRLMIHKSGTAARANLNSKGARRFK